PRKRSGRPPPDTGRRSLPPAPHGRLCRKGGRNFPQPPEIAPPPSAQGRSSGASPRSTAPPASVPVPLTRRKTDPPHSASPKELLLPQPRPEEASPSPAPSQAPGGSPLPGNRNRRYCSSG